MFIIGDVLQVEVYITYNRHIIVIFYALGDGSSTVKCVVHCDVNQLDPNVKVYLRTICGDSQTGVNSDPVVHGKLHACMVFNEILLLVFCCMCRA